MISTRRELWGDNREHGGLLEREHFRRLETGTRMMVAKHALSELPTVQGVTVAIL